MQQFMINYILVTTSLVPAVDPKFKLNKLKDSYDNTSISTGERMANQSKYAVDNILNTKEEK